jgi:hypothetical protein
MTATEIPAPERTSPHGSAPDSTPSMMVFMSVACGAGISFVPNV